MKSPQITLIDLLWCVALIGVGIGAPMTAYRVAGPQAPVFVFFLVGSPVLLGAALGLPFKRPVLGAILGQVLIWGPLFILVLWIFGFA